MLITSDAGDKEVREDEGCESSNVQVVCWESDVTSSLQETFPKVL